MEGKLTNKLTKEEVLKKISDEWDKVPYGKFTIEKNETSDKVDLIINNRIRFVKGDKEIRRG